MKLFFSDCWFYSQFVLVVKVSCIFFLENVVLPVVGSVVAVHIVIGAYVWVAMNEDSNPVAVKED